jgi:chromosome segregation ATPase
VEPSDRGVSRTALKREVLDLVQQFNIQVNNLTQFLPQDRVCEFAKLTPIQLLEETEKAVGDPELSGQHATLIKKSEELKHIETVSGLSDPLFLH